MKKYQEIEKTISKLLKNLNEENDLNKAPVIEDQPGMNRPHGPSQYDNLDSITTYHIGTMPTGKDGKDWSGHAGKPLYHHVFTKPAFGKNNFQTHLHTISLSPDPWADDTPIISSSINSKDIKPDEQDAYEKHTTKGMPWKEGRYTQIGETIARPSWRNYGLGHMLYEGILKHHGKLMSDTGVSNAANALWKKLITKENVKGQLGPYGKGGVHWAEYSGPKPEPISTLHYGGNSAYQLENQKKIAKSEDLFKGQMGDWKQEGYTLEHSVNDFGESDPTRHQHRITVKAPTGELAGSFIFENKNNKWMPTSSQVKPEHRRKGIASGAYGFFESKTGFKINPHTDQTPFAQKLWSQPNRQFGKSENGLAKTKHPFKVGDRVVHDNGKVGTVTAIKTEQKTKHKIKVKNDDHKHGELFHGGKYDMWDHAGYYLHHVEKGLRGDWKQEGYQLEHWQDKNGFHNVAAYDKNKNLVGEASFTYNYIPNELGTGLESGDLKGWNVNVHPDHQRKGLASAMYELAEKASGKKIIQGGVTDEGHKFWSQPNRSFGKSEIYKIFDFIEISTEVDLCDEDLCKVTNYDIGDNDNVPLITYRHINKTIKINSLPNGIEHVVKVDPKNHNDITHTLRKKGVGHPLAQIHVEMRRHHDTETTEPTISHSVVHPKYKGKGLGRLLYQQAIKHHGSLTSDSSISNNAHKMWMKLNNKKEGIYTELADRNDYDETPHRAFFVKSESISFYIEISDNENDELNKSDFYTPTQENEEHPTKPYVAKTHPNGSLMWHHNDEISRKNDQIINNKELRQKLLSTMPSQTHKKGMEAIINMVAKDPNRHFIPSRDGNVEKMRARHIKDLLLNPNSIKVDTSEPDSLKISLPRHGYSGANTVWGFNFVPKKVVKNEKEEFEKNEKKHNSKINEANGFGRSLRKHSGSAQTIGNNEDKSKNKIYSNTENNNIKKGAMRKLAPFNPLKDTDPEDQETLENWTSEVGSRNQVPAMHPNAKKRALHKLAGTTEVRKDPNTGERLFLLHRGMSEHENKSFHKDGQSNYKKNSMTSWTPKKHIANGFAEEYHPNQTNEYAKNVVSAWIPESDIHHVPNSSLLPDNTDDQFRYEHEIIVRHSKPHLHANKAIVDKIENPRHNIDYRVGLNKEKWERNLNPKRAAQLKIKKPE